MATHDTTPHTTPHTTRLAPRRSPLPAAGMRQWPRGRARAKTRLVRKLTGRGGRQAERSRGHWHTGTHTARGWLEQRSWALCPMAPTEHMQLASLPDPLLARTSVCLSWQRLAPVSQWRLSWPPLEAARQMRLCQEPSQPASWTKDGWFACCPPRAPPSPWPPSPPPPGRGHGGGHVRPTPWHRTWLLVELGHIS